MIPIAGKAARNNFQAASEYLSVSQFKWSRSSQTTCDNVPELLVLNNTTMGTVWGCHIRHVEAPDTFPDFRNVPHTF